MRILINENKLSVSLSSLNSAERQYMSEYFGGDGLVCRPDPKDPNFFEIRGRAERLYSELLKFSFDFDIELM